MAIYGYTKNYKLIKPKYDTDTWHDYEYDNLDTIDAVLSAIYASGDWQGFWKSNTHYNVGDIVIDRDTDTMYKVMVEHTTSAGSFAAEWTAHHNYYELWSPNDLAESWATKTDGKVSDTDYSSKAYAVSSGLINDGSAQEWAVKSGKIGNTNEYSAKKYATDAHNDYISMTTNPNVVAVGSNINNVNAVGRSISNVNKVAGNVSSVNAVGNNISSVNTAASNMAAIKAAPSAASNAANSANNSHIWAEGTDAQVAALGGVHSSKGWAEQSPSVNFSLTNTPYTTNRILEIPQDIKLELNNGTLTLKAGSKVYVPNGFKAGGTTPKFDVATVSSDVVFHTGTIGANSAHMMLVCNLTGGFGARAGIESYESGSTAPSDKTKIWYDTTNNAIKAYEGGSWVRKYSLPIGIYYRENGNAVAIDQVFNGFGYIGSTVFVLPGVQAQAPNGKNKDGTYNSSVYTTSTVLTMTIDASWGTFDIILARSSLNRWPDIINGSVGTRYNSENNYYEIYDAGQSKWVPLPKQLAIVKLKANTTSPYKITSFEPYTVDSVVNFNEFYQLKDKAVTTDTTQTISGVKTFKSVVTAESESINFNAKNPTMDVNETPSANKYVGYDFRGKNDVRIGYIGIIQGTDGTFSFTIQRISNYVTKIIGVTPPVNSSGTEIVTAGWFNSKMQVVSALPANPDPNVFYFIPG